MRHRRNNCFAARRCLAGCVLRAMDSTAMGRARADLDPRPTDFRRGIFKFMSTPYGAKPVRDDLLRTIRDGAKGMRDAVFLAAG